MKSESLGSSIRVENPRVRTLAASPPGGGSLRRRQVIRRECGPRLQDRGAGITYGLASPVAV